MTYYDPTDQYPLGTYYSPIAEEQPDKHGRVPSLQYGYKTNKTLADLEEEKDIYDATDTYPLETYYGPVKGNSEMGYLQSANPTNAPLREYNENLQKAYAEKIMRQYQAETNPWGIPKTEANYSVPAQTVNPSYISAANTAVNAGLAGIGTGIGVGIGGALGLSSLEDYLGGAPNSVSQMYNNAIKNYAAKDVARMVNHAKYSNAMSNYIPEAPINRGYAGDYVPSSTAAAEYLASGAFAPYIAMGAYPAAALYSGIDSYNKYKDGQMDVLYDEMMARPQD